MKKLKSLLSVLLLTILIVSLAGCGDNTKDKFYGEWAYIHDAENPVVVFKGNNKVDYKGEDYTYTFDDNFLTLSSVSDKDKVLTVRYQFDKDKLFLYEQTPYSYAGEGEPKDLVGRWENPNKWSFEFTSDGTFREDDYFPGYYTVNEDGSVKLVYNDHFPDTVIYYTIDGNNLTVDYPWEMVIAGKEENS